MSQRDEVTILMRQCGIMRKALAEISNAYRSGDVELLKSLAVSGLVEADAVRLSIHDTNTTSVPMKLHIPAIAV